LAVGSSPAEALPGDDVEYRILVVDDAGTVASPGVRWSYCNQPKPTNELNDVASACFGDNPTLSFLRQGHLADRDLAGDRLRAIWPRRAAPTDNSSGGGSSSSAQLTGRPTDPDSTDGYYQPVILQVTADQEQIPTLAETRITCGLAGSTGEQFEAFGKLTKSKRKSAAARRGLCPTRSTLR